MTRMYTLFIALVVTLVLSAPGTHALAPAMAKLFSTPDPL